MRPGKLRLLLLLATLLVALPTLAFEQLQYRCRMLDRVIFEPCCAFAHAARPQRDSAPSVRGEDCCKRVRASTQSLQGVSRTGASDVPAAVPASLVPPEVYAFPRIATVELPPLRARAPPALGPPLFIAHCAFLS